MPTSWATAPLCISTRRPQCITGLPLSHRSKPQLGYSLGVRLTASTIQYMIAQADKHYKNESLHQSDCSSIVSESLCRCLLREVRVNPEIKYKDLWLNLGLDQKAVSKAILYYILKKKGITNWLAKKRLLITLEMTVKHL